MKDLYLTENRDITQTSQNDLREVSGIENVVQSVGIQLASEARVLLGEQITGERLRQFGDSVERALLADPEVESVESLIISEINRESNTVVVEATVDGQVIELQL